MGILRHPVISIALSLAIVFFSTDEYMIVEDWGFLDSLYMTMIAISTVGYREVFQVGDLGWIL